MHASCRTSGPLRSNGRTESLQIAQQTVDVMKQTWKAREAAKNTRRIDVASSSRQLKDLRRERRSCDQRQTVLFLRASGAGRTHPQEGELLQASRSRLMPKGAAANPSHESARQLHVRCNGLRVTSASVCTIH